MEVGSPAGLAPAVREMNRGRSSPSFLIAVALAVVAVGGYTAWRIWRPNPVKKSERVVRDFTRAASREVGAMRRALRRLTAGRRSAPSAVAEAISARAVEAREHLEKLAEDARGRLEELEDLPWRTLRNRMGRIDKRLAESERFAQDLVEQTRSRLRDPEDGQR